MGIFNFYNGFNSETYQSALHIVLFTLYYLEIRFGSITSDFFSPVVIRKALILGT